MSKKHKNHTAVEPFSKVPAWTWQRVCFRALSLNGIKVKIASNNSRMGAKMSTVLSSSSALVFYTLVVQQGPFVSIGALLHTPLFGLPLWS